MAAAATATADLAGAGAALGRAKPLVEREQVGRQARRQRGPFGDRALDLGVDVGQGGVAPGLGRSPGLEVLAPQGGQPVELTLGGLDSLHHLELAVLQIGLPAPERRDLVLQVLQLLGHGDRPGLQALAVTVATGADLLDLPLELRLLAGQVGHLGLRAHRGVAQRADQGVEPHQLRQLGQRRASVAEPVQGAVQALQLQQTELDERVGLHCRGILTSATARRASTGR